MSEVETIKTHGETIIIRDPLKWDRNSNSGEYHSSGGGFVIYRDFHGDGWHLRCVEHNGITFSWVNDFWYLSDAKVAAKEHQAYVEQS